VKILNDVCYKHTALGDLLLDVYLPEKEHFAVILFFHGGGLEAGDRKLPAHIYEAVTARGFALVSAEYRMYPTAKFPDYLVDAADAAAWVLKEKVSWGAGDGLFLCGSSAGAYITMMLCMDPQYLNGAGICEDDITGFISDSSQQFCHFNVLREMGIDSRLEVMNDRAPISFVQPGKTIRPLLLIYYTDDMKCRPEENKLIYANMQHVMGCENVEIMELSGKHCSDSWRAFRFFCDFAKRMLE